jgi:magnesium transporter
MLYAYDAIAAGPIAPDLSKITLPESVIWIDLLRPEASEIGFIHAATGLRVPSLGELSEIESSSRVRREHDAFYLSAPIVGSNQGVSFSTPVGFVLTQRRLITVRFDELDVVTAVIEELKKPGAVYPSGAGVFLAFVEQVVERGADLLERVGSELGNVSRRVFRTEARRVIKRHRPKHESANLRDVLRHVGRNADLASDMRDSLLTLGRIGSYVSKQVADWLPTDMKPRLDTLHQDLTSLNDYENHLANKSQLLLDATLGLINIEQNDIIKVLAVVSVVGVPPTLVASIYGMNFKHMPELDWTWGYPFGIAAIVLSALLPLVWFYRRGWL